jgi:hypothetical protein
MSDLFASIPDEILEEIILDASYLIHEFDIRRPTVEPDLVFMEINERDWELEVLYKDWQESLSTRVALASLSRRFRQITTPVLYSSFFFDSEEQEKKITVSLNARPELGGFVKRIVVFGPPFGNGNYNMVSLLAMCPSVIILDSYVNISPPVLPASLHSLSLIRDVTQDISSVIGRLQHLEWAYFGLSNRYPITHSSGNSVQIIQSTNYLSIAEAAGHSESNDDALGSLTKNRFVLHSIRTTLSHLSMTIPWLLQLNGATKIHLPRLQHFHLSVLPHVIMSIRGSIVDMIQGTISFPSLITFAITVGYAGFIPQVQSLFEEFVQRHKSMCPHLKHFLIGGPRDMDLKMESFGSRRPAWMTPCLEAMAFGGISWYVYAGAELHHVQV